MAFTHTGYQTNTLNSNPSGFYEYLPDGYDPLESYSLVVYLGGLAAEGNGTSEIDNVLLTGIAQYIDTDSTFARNCIVLSPQQSSTVLATYTTEMEAFITWALSNYNVSATILWGFSEGSDCVNTILFNGAVTVDSAISMAATDNSIDLIGNTSSYWAFHSFDDAIASVSVSDILVGSHLSTLSAEYPMELAYPYGDAPIDTTVADNIYTMTLTSGAPITYDARIFTPSDGLWLKLTVIDAVTDVTPYISGLGAGYREHGCDYDTVRYSAPWEFVGISNIIPDVPKNIEVTKSDMGLLFTWSSVFGATSYDVEFNGIAVNTPINSYGKTGLTKDTAYTYRIRSKGPYGDSAYSPLTTVYTANYNTDTSTPAVSNVYIGVTAGILNDLFYRAGIPKVWTSSNRPSALKVDSYIGINSETGTLEYTIDSGTTWLKYDGTLV